MKKIFVITAFVLIALFFSFSVFGAITYKRTPSDFEIFNPVSFEVSGVFETNPTWNSYQLNVYGAGLEPYEQISPCFTTTNTIWTRNFVLGTYYFVEILGYTDVGCIEYLDWTELEGNIVEEEYLAIFEIRESSFLFVTENFVANSLAYVSQAIIGLSPFLFVIIGIPLGFLVIRRVMNFMPKK